MKAQWIIVFFQLAATLSFSAQDSQWINTSGSSGDFPLAHQQRAATLVYDPVDAAVVGIAVRDLAADIERVTGFRPAVETNLSNLSDTVVFVGTLGGSSTIDRLAREGKFDAGPLRGQWESFIIATVTNPLPGVARGLILAGSDRRGTAFAVYELSQAIGVSPWHWWADVPPVRRDALYVPAGTRRFGPPSVKYRGIFLNDEDWALQPWAAKTFEPEVGDIGPKTYARIFELLLRLKANTLWPAMHACTKPFNHYPENKRVADNYAIVMGSSHAEPMLRNNVGEWTNEARAFNYVANREGVLNYWEQRVRENGKFENIYTLGMRGIHDSGMQGPRGRNEQIRVLEQIFSDQRDLLARHVRPDVETIPQMFCAYKEVLALYRGGLKVPDDVTIMFPDDNFGYIRDFPGVEERRRKGGFGVYYHLSYLGRPLAYLWLYTTPPALVWEEMSKAYDHGARTMWIANVGDLKPAEIGTEFFLQMAWNIERWRRDNLPEFLVQWAAREFGEGRAASIASVMDRYYRMNYQRRPEHLQWWLPNEERRSSPLTPREVDERLSAFARLRSDVQRIERILSSEQRDAFFQLVGYPVHGSALANERYFHGERDSSRALEADRELKELNRRFNEEVAGGKWRNFMTLEPADREWRSMRIAAWEPLKRISGRAADSESGDHDNPNDSSPVPNALSAIVRDPAGYEFIETNGIVSIEAEHFTSKQDRNGAGWGIIPGLGRTGDSVAVFPTTAQSIATNRLTTDAPRLTYRARFESAGEFNVTLNFIPTQPLVPGGGLRVAIGIDDTSPAVAETTAGDGSPAWAQSVLNNTVTAETRLQVPTPGTHEVNIYMIDTGVVLDRILLHRGPVAFGYLGPAETRLSANQQ